MAGECAGRRRVEPSVDQPTAAIAVRPRSRASLSSCPIARAAAAVAIRDAADAGRRAADRRLHRGEPRLQAPVPALPDRAGLRRPVPHRAGRRRARGRRARRSRRAPGTSRSAIPISSTARRTRCGSSTALAREYPGRHLRRDDQGRAPAAASRLLPRAARHRLRCSSRARWSRWTIDVLAQLERGTRARISSARRAVPRGAADARRRRSCLSRRG